MTGRRNVRRCRKWTTYGVVDPRSGKIVYVGQSCNMRRRIERHSYTGGGCPQHGQLTMKRWMFEKQWMSKRVSQDIKHNLLRKLRETVGVDHVEDKSSSTSGGYDLYYWNRIEFVAEEAVALALLERLGPDTGELLDLGLFIPSKGSKVKTGLKQRKIFPGRHYALSRSFERPEEVLAAKHSFYELLSKVVGVSQITWAPEPPAVMADGTIEEGIYNARYIFTADEEAMWEVDRLADQALELLTL